MDQKENIHFNQFRIAVACGTFLKYILKMPIYLIVRATSGSTAFNSTSKACRDNTNLAIILYESNYNDTMSI